MGDPSDRTGASSNTSIIQMATAQSKTCGSPECSLVWARIDPDERHREEPRSGDVPWSAIPQTPRDPRSRDLPRDRSGAGAISAAGEIASLPTVARNDELPPI